jgi:hypothetical protein
MSERDETAATWRETPLHAAAHGAALRARRQGRRGRRPAPQQVNSLPHAVSVQGLAVDDTHVYWLDGERKLVGRRPP